MEIIEDWYEDEDIDKAFWLQSKGHFIEEDPIELAKKLYANRKKAENTSQN